MRLERHKNFLSKAECEALNNWVDFAIADGQMKIGIDLSRPEPPRRYTSRFSPDTVEYPELVLEIAQRVRAACGVAERPIIHDHGRHGVVVSCTLPGGDIHLHQDPHSPDGLFALRCNILTRAADVGGNLMLGGEEVVLDVGELHCYLASAVQHRVTQVQGNTSRVLWMFGAYVPSIDWESGRIKVVWG